MTLDEGDVLLHRFSPTGFYSSAVRNPFLRSLEARSDRQIAYTNGLPILPSLGVRTDF